MSKFVFSKLTAIVLLTWATGSTASPVPLSMSFSWLKRTKKRTTTDHRNGSDQKRQRLQLQQQHHLQQPRQHLLLRQLLRVKRNTRPSGWFLTSSSISSSCRAEFSKSADTFSSAVIGLDLRELGRSRRPGCHSATSRFFDLSWPAWRNWMVTRRTRRTTRASRTEKSRRRICFNRCTPNCKRTFASTRTKRSTTTKIRRPEKRCRLALLFLWPVLF